MGAGAEKSTAAASNPTPSFGLGLGKPPQQPSSPAPATSTPDVKQPEKSLFSGFGLGKPPAQAQSNAPSTPAKAPFSFGAPATTTPQAPPPSLFSKPAPVPVSSTPVSKPAEDGKFAIPSRTPVKESPQVEDGGSRQMAAVMQRMVADLVSEIKAVSSFLVIWS